LSELHRVAVPGEVAPALFWALPVGEWRPNELDDVWWLFTEQSSKCNKFGLLLVKDLGRKDPKQTNVSLASLGAKLSDLVPPGAKRFARSAFKDISSPRILVLSGGYPQPGWGVLVDWKSVPQFENLIGSAAAGLDDPGSSDKLNLFAEANVKFCRLKDLRKPPAKRDVELLDAEIRAAEKIAEFVREAQTALQAGEYRLLGERMNAAGCTSIALVENSRQFASEITGHAEKPAACMPSVDDTERGL
jgi:hypothetical protein